MASYFAGRRALLWAASPLIIAVFAAYLFRPFINATNLQCKALSYTLSGKVSYPASSVYAESLSSYWSKQEESLAPSCIVTPASEDDVAVAVKTLATLGCTFAIRGGGHTPWASSANINGGVTIDMRLMNAVTMNKDNTVASVGAGAVWGDVYKKMDSLGLAVIGGRGSSIGVGGLTTGGKQRPASSSQRINAREKVGYPTFPLGKALRATMWSTIESSLLAAKLLMPMLERIQISGSH